MIRYDDPVPGNLVGWTRPPKCPRLVAVIPIGVSKILPVIRVLDLDDLFWRVACCREPPLAGPYILARSFGPECEGKIKIHTTEYLVIHKKL